MFSAGMAGTERRVLLLLMAACMGTQMLSWMGLCTSPWTALLDLRHFGPASAFLGSVALIYAVSGAGIRHIGVLLLASALGTGFLRFMNGSAVSSDIRTAMTFALIAGILGSLLCIRSLKDPNPVVRQRSLRIFQGGALLLLYNLACGSLLDLTTSLHPATHDFEMLHIDMAYGGSPSRFLAEWTSHTPWADAILERTYASIGIAIVLLFGLQLRRAEASPIHVVEVMVVSGAAALVAFHFYPVAGPKFGFAGLFPDRLPSLDRLPFEIAQTVPVPRNGVPSLHFGWSFALWYLSLSLGVWIAALFGIFAALTALSTLSTGEHYLVDLVVALPFMLAVFAAISRRLPWQGLRKRLLSTGGLVYLAWILALRFGSSILAAHPVMLWSASVGTAALCAAALTRLHRANAAAPAWPEIRRIENPVLQDPAITSMFFISGAAALTYQVVFAKQLAYMLGSMAVAVNTVLAVYMGGMALGAAIGGRVAARTQRPLRLYALCELGIGLYCALISVLLSLLRGIYVHWGAGSTGEGQMLLVLRVLLGAAVLLPPTILMGMTLPILVRQAAASSRLAPATGILYAWNTAGAALGALTTGYWVVPLLGLRASVLLAVVANLAIAAWALRHRLAGADANRSTQLPSPTAVAVSNPRTVVAAMVVLGVGGFVTLGLEVIDTHLLAVAAGNSTYAFALMLFAFLAGLGLGAAGARHWCTPEASVRILPWLELGLAAAIIVSVHLIGSLPEYFSTFDGYPRLYSWASRETIRAFSCFAALLPPAFLIGAIFPIAVQCITEERQGAMRSLGSAIALNTAGNILGALVTGFLLLPHAGAVWCAQALATLCLLLAFGFAMMSEFRSPQLVLAGTAAAIIAWWPLHLDYDSLTSGANVYFAPVYRGHVIDHAESLDGGLTSVNESEDDSGGRVLTLLTNGKFQGNDSERGEMQAQAAFALAPLLHTSGRDRALVVGYGTGHTSRLLHDAGFRDLDIAELSADIYALANRHLGRINARVSEQPGVHAHVVDGRNFLLLTQQRYDVISMEITSIWFAGAASLYNADYYRIAKARLAPDGVLQQWMQLHHAAPEDLLYVLGSIRAVFRQVWVYVAGGQAIVVASDASDAADRQRRLWEAPASMAPGLREVAGELLLGPEGVDRLLASGGAGVNFVSTDDNAWLEYHTPKGNALSADASVRTNMALLMRFAAPAAK